MEREFKPILIRYGGAKKFVGEMTSEELAGAAASILRRAREKSFYKGLPIYYANGNNIIAEYADGRKVVVKKLEHAQTLRHSRAQRNR